MPQSQEQQTVFVRERMAAYFTRLAEISTEHPPSAANAAHGVWRDQTVEDARLRELEADPTEPLDGDAEQVFASFKKLQAGIRKAFVDNPNHEANLDTDPDLIWPPIEDVTGNIIDIVGSLYDLFGKDEARREEAKTQLRADIEALINRLKEMDYTLSGTHANGYLAAGAKSAFDQFVADLSADFPQPPPGANGQLVSALKTVGQGMATLPTDGHDPWLRADWQVAFEKRAQAAALGLAP